MTNCTLSNTSVCVCLKVKGDFAHNNDCCSSEDVRTLWLIDVEVSCKYFVMHVNPPERRFDSTRRDKVQRPTSSLRALTIPPYHFTCFFERKYL